MLRRLNLHVFLNFAAGVKGKQWAVRALAGGFIAANDAVLLIGPTGLAKTAVATRTRIDKGADMTLAPSGERETPSVDPSGRQEGVSYAKVSRGDRTPVELFVAGVAASDIVTGCLELPWAVLLLLCD
jgi:hypothetical protein